MKTLRILSVFAFLLIVAIHANAQGTKDFFVGDWHVLINSAQGEMEMDLSLERVDGKLSGTMTVMGGEIELPSVEESEDKITIQVEAMGNTSILTFTKKDEDHISGKSSSGSELEGERVK